MSPIQAYFKGWSSIVRHRRMWLLMYTANFVLAFLAAIPVSGFLGNTVGHSLSLARSLEGFDYIFLYEVMNEYGELVRSILDQSLLFVLLFFLVSIFLMGGFLNIFRKDAERFGFKLFLRGCAKYFWKLLRLTIYFLLIQVLVLGLFIFLFIVISGGLNPFALESEYEWINAFMVLAPIYVLVYTIIAMIHDYAKIHIVHENPVLLVKPFWESFKIVFKNFWKFFFLYLLNILTFGLLFMAFWGLKGVFGTATMAAVLLTFVLGQLFILGRIGIKLLNLSSATYLYQARDKVPTPEREA